MKNGKYVKRRGVATKTMMIVLAVMLVVGCSIGGTIAWLTDTTKTVTNTFTPSDIAITLTETKGVVDGKWEKEMVPGVSYDKDPVVAVDENKTDIDCYLFVKFEENEAAQTYLEYTSTLNTDNGWKLVPDQTNVWYRVVETTDDTKSWHLLADDEVTVSSTAVTKDTMATAAAAKLTYTAYAIQYVGFETNVTAAWAQASAQQNG